MTSDVSRDSDRVTLAVGRMGLTILVTPKWDSATLKWDSKSGFWGFSGFATGMPWGGWYSMGLHRLQPRHYKGHAHF